jgi:PAS domain S-box-containing protein
VTVSNTLTKQKIEKASPTNVEVLFEGGIVITETNLGGIITYANRAFLELNGYSEKEIIGIPHSINRHPDMPGSIYKKMWKTIQAKKIWRGYLKNMTRDGSYYWVIVWIQPKFDENKNVVGYVASRKAPYRRVIDTIERQYLSLPKQDREKTPYPYGKELSFGSDFIASKHLDLTIEDRLHTLVDKKQ